MKLNDTGQIVNDIWQSLSNRFDIKLDQFQIMPNHFHGIIQILKTNKSVGAIHESPLPTPIHRSLLSQIIGYFKMNTSKLTNQKLWQRNYYEHIIHHEKEYWAIKRYIIDNPKNWEEDIENI